MLVKDALPVGVHAPVQGLVIEQLRGPFDRVDLGDLRRHDQPSDLEQFMRGDISVANHAIGMGRISQATVRLGNYGRLFPEFLDEAVVLPRKDVMIEAQPDGPVVGKGRGFLAGPLGNDRIARFKDRQVTKLVARPSLTGSSHSLAGS